MQRNAVLAITLLLSVALVAGCVGQLPGIPGFGSDVIKPSRTVTNGPVTDVLVIEKLISSPETLARPNQTVQIFMTATSREPDPRLTASARVQLFDAFIFKSADGTLLCNSPTLPNGCPSVGDQCTMDNSCTFSAGETKQIRWLLLTPTVAEIANIATSGTLAYRLLYVYNSSTNFDVLVVTNDEILRLQQQGQTLSVPLQESRSSGPIVISFDQPVQFALPHDTLYVTVKVSNVGAGTVDNSTIGEGKLSVEIPTSLASTVAPPAEYFRCDERTTDKTICRNIKSIQLIKKESIPFLFQLQNVVPELTVPHRTFTLSATVSYTYELRSSLSLTIQPLTV